MGLQALNQIASVVPLHSPWQSIGAPFAPKLVLIQVTDFGLYVLSGSLTAATSDPLIALLPAEARPPFETPGLAALDGVPVPIRLLANGQVRLATAPASAVGSLHISTLFYGA